MKRKIIFIHIPKSGGSTFHSILNVRYKKINIYNIFGGRFSDPEIINFINLPNKEKSKIKLLKGHMPFGLHKYLDDEFEYITFVRNPFERVISQFYYIKQNKKNPKHEQVHLTGMGIKEFVTSGIVSGMNNGHCRFLTGDVDRLPYGVSNNLIEETLENVNKKFMWIGVTERFDESILVLAFKMGWKKLPYYIKQNVSQISPRSKGLCKKDIYAIKAYNKEDMKLYEWANDALDYEISKIRNFDLMLDKFKEKNKMLAKKWAWLPDRVQKYII